MKFKFLLTIVAFFSLLTINSQNTATLKGTVKTAQGEPIMGANISIKNSNKGTTSDIDGKYELKLSEGKSIIVEVSFLGYNTIKKEMVVAKGEITQNFILEESSYLLEGVVVSAQKREQRNKEVPIAITSYGTDFINNQGTFEYDALSEFVPGFQVQIQSANNPGIVVRGITSDSGDSRVEPRVSIFQDGVSISKSRGSVVELFDIV